MWPRRIRSSSPPSAPRRVSPPRKLDQLPFLFRAFFALIYRRFAIALFLFSSGALFLCTRALTRTICYVRAHMRRLSRRTNRRLGSEFDKLMIITGILSLINFRDYRYRELCQLEKMKKYAE